MFRRARRCLESVFDGGELLIEVPYGTGRKLYRNKTLLPVDQAVVIFQPAQDRKKLKGKKHLTRHNQGNDKYDSKVIERIYIAISRRCIISGPITSQ